MTNPKPAHQRLEPLGGLATWMGGKTALSKHILPSIESRPHRVYVEPFVGLGGLFFQRRAKPKLEVINDLNDDVVNLFRIAQCHPDALIDELALSFFSRGLFERYVATRPDQLTDLQRAARFYYIQRFAYGGRTWKPSIAPSRTQAKSLNLRKLRLQFRRVQRRIGVAKTTTAKGCGRALTSRIWPTSWQPFGAVSSCP